MVRACLVALTAALGAAVPAQAGSYHVSLCQTPAGHHAPLPINALYESNVDYIGAHNDCGGSTGTAGITSGWLARQATAVTYQTLTAPSFASISHLDLTREVRLRSEVDPGVAFPMWGVFRDQVDFTGNGRQLESCDPYHLPRCFSLDRSQPLSVDLPAGTRSIVWMVGCGGVDVCVQSSDGASDRAVGTVYAVHLVVSESTPPTGSVTGTATLVNASHAGTEIAEVSGSDGGAGVYQAFATLDGVAAGRVNAPGSGCSDKGNTPSTDLDFEAFQPCPGSVSGLKLPVNTKVVSDGSRRLRVFVRDAAGNQTQIYDQLVTVANGAAAAPAAPGSTGGGAAPGTPAGHVVVLHRKRPRATVRRGGKLSIALKAVDAAGAPLPGASIGVQERLALPGAAWVTRDPLTAGPDGKVIYKPSTTASRELQFTYAYDGGSFALPFELSVQAKLSIKAARTVVGVRGTLRLSGRVIVDQLPSAGTYVDLQVRNGKRWQTIDTKRTKANGRWSWSYRFRRGGRATYKFRARLRRYSDVPAAASSSRTVIVRVR